MRQSPALVKATEPPAVLGGDAVADTSQTFKVIPHRLCRNHAKILFVE